MPPSPHADFGSLIKHWRTLRRKTQFDLGLRAGVSVRHISFLETGRARPSRDMVLTLAESLEMPARDRNTLLRFAGFADVYPESKLKGPALEPARRALEFLLARHEPYPAIVIDSAWNARLANAAARKFVGMFLAEAAPLPTNLLRFMFDPNGLRPSIENWSEIATELLRRLRRDAAGAPDDAPIRRLLTELLAMPGVPDGLAGTKPPEAPLMGLVLRRGALRLRVFSLVSSFGIPLDVTLHELRIETLFPADDATEQFLRKLGAAELSSQNLVPADRAI